jgi:hypothetical protein
MVFGTKCDIEGCEPQASIFEHYGDVESAKCFEHYHIKQQEERNKCQ